MAVKMAGPFFGESPKCSLDASPTFRSVHLNPWKVLRILPIVCSKIHVITYTGVGRHEAKCLLALNFFKRESVWK